MKKVVYAGFLGIVLLMCLTLSVGMALFGPAQAGANEQLQQPPAWKTEEGDLNPQVLTQLQAYVNDRFFLRQELISVNNLLDPGSDSVIRGKEGLSMRFRRFTAVFLAVLLLLSLTACGAASKLEMADGSMNAVAEDVEHIQSGDGLSKEEASASGELPANQKLIRRIYMDAETEDMDPLLSQVEQRITQLGGYVQSRQVYNGSTQYSRSRNAEMTIRIPAESLDQFVEQVSQASNITSLRETAEDVTLSYVATESRIAALETEQTRLLELLAMAESMEDLLLIESRLTEVRAQLQEVKSQLKLYDNQISYGTIYLYVSEVREYTRPQEEPEGFFARIGKGFVKSATGLWNGFLELVVFLAANLPYFLFLGLVIWLIVVLVRRRKKKRMKRAAGYAVNGVPVNMPQPGGGETGNTDR